MEDEQLGVIRMTASAPGYDCDVCGGCTGVCHVAIPESWRHPEDGHWIDLLTWHDCYLCQSCAGSDGGLVSDSRRDGWVVYRIRGRLVFVPAQNTKH